MPVPKSKLPRRPQEPPAMSDSDLFQDIASQIAKSVQSAQTLDEEKVYLMQRAPNAIEWITREEFCNKPTLFKHYGQYKMVKEFFELRCPVCPQPIDANPWWMTRTQLESEILLRWTPSVEDDACPKCGNTRAQFIEDGLMFGYHTLHGIVGMRAGKSAGLALIGTYVEHVILTIAHTYSGGIQSYLGTQPGDQFDITYVASTDVQSQDTIWAKYRGFRLLSPWFGRYVPWIKSQEKLQKTPVGMQRWEYVENDKTIKNESVRVKINSLNSNSSGLVGRTRLGAFIDEICRMEQTDSKRSANEVYRGLENSCHTVRTRVEMYGLLPWLGIVGSISSPVSAEDKGMKLLEAARRVTKMYSFHLPTWEFNPFEPRAAFEDDYKKDPIGSERDYGAQPPMAAFPLVDDPDRFKKSTIDPLLRPTARFEEYEFEDQGRHYKATRLVKAELMRNAAPRFVAVDAGKNFDAFAVACAHGEEDKDGNITTVFDWLIRLVPRFGQEIYFESIYTVIADIQKHYPIAQVEFDHWNSTHIIQRLRTQLGLRSEESETTNKHFIQFLRDGYSGQLRLLPPADDDDARDPPFMSPAGAAIYEILHLERDPEKDKVFNPRKGQRRGWDSDDVARVIVHAHRLVQDQGFTEKYDDMSVRARRKRAEIGMADWASQQRGGVFHVGNNNGIIKPITNKRGW